MSQMNLPISSGSCVRRSSRSAEVGYGERKILIGGGALVVVQSMTNTDTVDQGSGARRFGAGAHYGEQFGSGCRGAGNSRAT
jgi:hypothetical protein